MPNPGPASFSLPTSQAVLAPVVNPETNASAMQFQGTNALRCIAAARSVSLAATGDAAIVPVINTSSYNPVYVIVTNAQLAGVGGSIASAALGVWTGAAQTGTNIMANATLASNTTQAYVLRATVVAGTVTTAIFVTPGLSGANQNVYINVGTALATATCDVFVYGFDLT